MELRLDQPSDEHDNLAPRASGQPRAEHLFYVEKKRKGNEGTRERGNEGAAGKRGAALFQREREIGREKIIKAKI